MRKIPNIIRIGAIVSIAWFAAAALTPLTSVAIRNSTIDSTVIGGTTPSTVRGTTLTSNGRPTNPVAPNTSTMAWNGSNGSGETDFINDYGASYGGFNWYATGNSLSHNWGSPVMSLSAGGTASANIFNGQMLMAISQYPAANGYANGAWLGWNQTFPNTGSSFGETDFVNQHTSGSLGGFNWYDTVSATATGTQIARMDAAGNLSLRSITASAGLSGSLSGNASTASSLASAPSNCGSTTPATGIQANGNANCGSYPFSATEPGYATLPGGIIIQWGVTGTYDTGPVSVSFARTFPHSCLNATVGSVLTSASRISSLVSCTTTSITMENNGSGASNYTAIGW